MADVNPSDDRPQELKDLMGYLSQMDASKVEELIADAMKERDFEQVVGLIKVLASIDPERAQAALDVINLGLEVAKRRGR